MAIHIQNQSKDDNNCESTIHLLPCTIKCNDDANVSTFFQPNIVKNEYGMLASFRGYPLMGKELNVPTGFNGYVLYEANEKLNEEVQRTIYVSECFKKFNYWNFDKLPTANDNIHNAMSWINLSKAIHSPIDDSNL